MARNSRTFSDLDINFIANPISGDIARKFDENSVKQAVKNLIYTNHYERPFHPEIGSQIRALLFEPFTPLTKAMLERSIINTIENYEPRVVLLDVQVNGNPDNNALYASISFRIVNTTNPINVGVMLDRTR